MQGKLPGFLTLVLIHLYCVSVAIPPATLKDSEEDYPLTYFLEIFEDEGKKLTIHEVTNLANSANFKKNSSAYPYAENPNSAYWIRVWVLNESSPDKKWIFEVLSLHTQNLQIFFPDGKEGFQQYQTGQDFGFGKRAYRVKNFIFDLPDIRGKVYPVYIRVESKTGVSFEYKIRTQQAFTVYTTSEYYYLGLYYGILIFLIIYTLLLFFSSGEKAYLFYIFYILSCILISLEGDGLGFQFLWPENPSLNVLASSFWLPFIFLISFIYYAKYFTGLKQNFPVLNDWISASTVFYFLFEISGFLPEIFVSYFYMFPLILVYSTAIIGYLQGATANRYFIIGQTFLLLSILITRSSWFGFIESNLFTVYSFNYGVLLEVVLFSYAFIDKYNLVKKEREVAQEGIILQLEENKKLQTKVNRELEEKVTERTLQLKEESQKLSEVNQKLELLMKEVNSMNSRLDYDNWQLNKKVSEETKARILAKDISFDEFRKIFPNEISCLKFLEELKWKKDYTCKKCGNTKYIQIQKLLSRRCSKCSYIESVTSSTLFHSLKFPIHKAFYIVYHSSFSELNLTIDELSDILELRRNTCWNFKKRVMERMERASKNGKPKQNKWELLIFDHPVTKSTTH